MYMGKTPLEWAIAYAKAGLILHPCYQLLDGSKKPLQQKGWQVAATNDPERVAKWFKGDWTIGDVTIKIENVLIGMQTGTINGIDAIDIDPIKGGLDTIPNAENWAQVLSGTPSGGQHIIGRHDPKLNLRNQADAVVYKNRRVRLPGCDTRTTGGYIILPGSIRPDGKMYTWLKGSILTPEGKLADLTELNIELMCLKAIEPPPQSKKKKYVPGHRPIHGSRKARALAYLEGRAKVVAETPEGSRDSTLNTELYIASSFIRFEIVTREELESIFYAAGLACGLEDHTVKVKLKESIDAGLKKDVELPLPFRDDDWMERTNEQYFIVENEGDKPWVCEWYPDKLGRDTLSLMRFKDFEQAKRSEWVPVGDTMKQLGKAWLDDPRCRKYPRLTFDPGKEYEISPDGYLNLWRGWPVPLKPGNWQRMKGHIYRTLANRNYESFKYIIMWTAWCLQNPGEPAITACIFRGGQGTGKGMFARALKDMYGRHGLQVSSLGAVIGKFNYHLRDVCLLYLDEAIAPDDRAGAGKLKSMLSEKSINIEGKGVNIKGSINHLKFIGTTNETWSANVDADDRRYAIFDVNLDLPKMMHGRFTTFNDYFKWIHEELGPDNLGAMLYDLTEMDLGEWIPSLNIPKTEVREEMQNLSRNPFTNILESKLDGYEGRILCLDVMRLISEVHRGSWEPRHNIWMSTSMKELGWKRKQIWVRYINGKEGRKKKRFYVKGDETLIIDVNEVLQQSMNGLDHELEADLQDPMKNVDLVERMEKDDDTSTDPDGTEPPLH